MQGQIFDFDQSLRRFAGDRGLYRDLIRFFLEDSPKLLGEARRGLATNDAKAVGHAAHTLKSLAANFMARRAAGAADQLERLADSSALPSAGDCVCRLEQEVSLLQQSLRAIQDSLQD
jgi:HPt (histidine-containing phosphotransfer) domain-containing protein